MNCFTPGARATLGARCDGRTSCSVSPAEFSSTVSADPCPGTDKYLEAHYLCLPATTATGATGEEEEEEEEEENAGKEMLCYLV